MFFEIMPGTYIDRSPNLTKQLRDGEISRKEFAQLVNREASQLYQSIRSRCQATPKSDNAPSDQS